MGRGVKHHPSADSKFVKSKEPFKQYVTGLGGRGLAKKITKCDIGGGVLSLIVMSLLQNHFVSKIAF